jgi:pyruvate-ferredoxin/flavodoxin oxidoreductase
VDVLAHAAPGSTLLLNSPYTAGETWQHLPPRVRQRIRELQLRVFAIDATRVAAEAGMGRRVNTVLQACFFELSGVLPHERAIEAIKAAARKTYASKGQPVVDANCAAIDAAIAALEAIEPQPEHESSSDADEPSVVPDDAPAFVRCVTRAILEGHGDQLPVSALPADGTYPTGTSRWEKRNIADRIPVWDADLCIQCNKCVLVCPHAAIRVKAYPPALLSTAPETFKSMDYKGAEFLGMKYTIQVAPEDCTGCELCAVVCPAKHKQSGTRALEMAAQRPLRKQEATNFEYFLSLPEPNRAASSHGSVKGSQFLQPLFEFSGACSGCGETPYLKLATQLFGDRMLVANATGCSSIFGGNLPTTPWTCNRDGLGPAWANSLFEDNAEFGLGLRLAVDRHEEEARSLLRALAPTVDLGAEPIADPILSAVQRDESGIFEQRQRAARLKERLRQRLDAADVPPDCRPSIARLLDLADYLVKKSVWIIGGDGWAYDIGYGGLDHVLASGQDVNVLVLDTEVYSNTGGQASKSTPRAAVARFAAAGKRTGKKDLALLAMTYGHVYVAHVALGANDTQTVKAFLEAESYPGPSLIIAYAHCIAHGIDIKNGLLQQSRAVASGHWPLFRYDPRATGASSFPLTLDSKPPKIPFATYAYEETRYNVLKRQEPEAAATLAREAQQDIDKRWRLYEQLAGFKTPTS